MRKIVCILSSLLILMMIMTGCAQCINTETETVSVTVVDSYYCSSYITMQYNPATKTSIPITYPAVYKIMVEYENTRYTVTGQKTYEVYAEKIGETTNGTLETKTYDNGTVKHRITELELK